MTSRLWGADKLIAVRFGLRVMVFRWIANKVDLIQLQHSYKPIIRHSDVTARCERQVALLQKEMDDAE